MPQYFKKDLVAALNHCELATENSRVDGATVAGVIRKRTDVLVGAFREEESPLSTFRNYQLK